MKVDGFAGQKQAHDFARPFEDEIDAEVAHHSLDGDRFLAARSQGGGCFISPPAANLHGVVDDLPARLRVEHLCHCGFQTNVITAAVHQRSAQLRDRLHGKDCGGHASDFFRYRFVFPYRNAPLDPLVAPPAADLQGGFARARGSGWQGEPPRVQGDESQLQSRALFPEYVLSRNAHVVKTNDAVFNGLQTHEMAAAHDLDSRPAHLHDKRGYLPLFLSVDDLGRRTGHDYEQFRPSAVRAPELFSVQNESVSVFRGNRHCRHVGRVGTCVHFRQGKGRDGSSGQPGHVSLFLLRCAEQFQRLWDANGLMGGEQRPQGAVLTADQRHGPVVGQLGKAQAAVLPGNLDAKSSHPAQFFHNLFGDPAFPVDGLAVDPRAQEFRQLVQKLPRPRLLFGVLLGMRMNKADIETAHEKLSQKAGPRPLLLSRGLGHLSGLRFRGLFGKFLIFHGRNTPRPAPGTAPLRRAGRSIGFFTAVKLT